MRKDAAMVEKEAVPELLKLIKARLGLELPEGTSVTEARDEDAAATCWSTSSGRDLSCEPPKSVGMVPGAAGQGTDGAHS